MGRLESSSLHTDGGALTIKLTISPEEESPDTIHASLSEHDDIGVHFFAAGPCQKLDSTWQLNVPVEPITGRRRVVQISSLTDSIGAAIDIIEPQVFLEPISGDAWESGTVALAELERVVGQRTKRFDVTIDSDASKSSDPVFSVVILADGLLLTTPARVPGVQVIPLSESTLGSDGVEVLNSVMAQLGFTSGIHPTEWIKTMRQQRPAVIVHIPALRARDGEATYIHSRSIALRLLDLLALRRGSKPRIIGGAVGTLGAVGATQFIGSWVEGAGYTGNLLGGFTSGEDPHSLIDHWKRSNEDPRLPLWLSLYSDAIADGRWEYRLFRCFNLLEGIAKEKFPTKQQIVESDGKPKMLADGKNPYTTNHARGSVFELLRMTAAKTNQAESNFASPLHNGQRSDLWDDVGIWVEIRNAVAHRGGWSLPKGVAGDKKHVDTEQSVSSRGHDQTFESGVDAIVRSVRSAAESVIYAGLSQKI